MYYFSYGSNCYSPQVTKRTPGAELAAKATIPGYEFGWSRRPNEVTKATCRPLTNGSGSLGGVIWKNVDPEKMDIYEGEGVAYRRMNVPARVNGGRLVDVFTYEAIEGEGVARPGWPGYRDLEYVSKVALGRSAVGLETPDAHIVFVYGSLMRKFHNHFIIGRGVLSSLLSPRATLNGHTLHDLGSFPAALAGGPTDSIKGEVWLVNGDTLADMDILEGHPRMYERRKVTVQGYTVWTYIYQRQVRGAQIPSGCWREHTGSTV